MYNQDLINMLAQARAGLSAAAPAQQEDTDPIKEIWKTKQKGKPLAGGVSEPINYEIANDYPWMSTVGQVIGTIVGAYYGQPQAGGAAGKMAGTTTGTIFTKGDYQRA